MRPYRYFLFKPFSYQTTLKKMDNPMSWNDVMIALARELELVPVRSFNKPRFRSLSFLWSPFLGSIIIQKIIRGKVLYLCWGLSRAEASWVQKKLSSLRLYFCLLLSDLVFVNDEITRVDLSSSFGIASNLIPYFVDVNYFAFKRKLVNRNVLLVPGDNDRDEDLVLDLVEAGYDIVRVTRSKNVVSFYSNRKYLNGSLCLLENVSYLELRDLYYNCDFVIMPIMLSSQHAAGQTAVLEALSCGCPVLISKSRTSSIFSHIDTLLEVKSNDVSSFVEQIELMKLLLRENPNKLELTSNFLKKSYSLDSCVMRLFELI